MGKKLWEILEENKEANDQEIKKINKKASEDFNNLIQKEGAYNTNNHYTTAGNLRKAYKGTNAYNTVDKSLNDLYYTNQKQPSIWDKITYTAKNFGFGAEKGTAGIAQGVILDSANEMQKGKTRNEEDIWKDFYRGYINDSLHFRRKLYTDALNESINTAYDPNKSLWEKIVDINLNAQSAVLKANTPGYGFYSSANQLLGKYMNADEQLLDLNSKIEKPLNEQGEKLAEEGKNYDKATNFVAEASQSVGNMVPSIAATAITKNPNIGLLAMGASVKGQATQEALNKGMDLNKANQIGDAKAAIEIGTEQLSGGTKIFGKGSMDDIAKAFIKKHGKSNLQKLLMQKGYNALGEIVEEEISNVVGNAIDKGTVDPDKKIIDWQEAGNTAASTVLTTAILNALTGGTVSDYNEYYKNSNQYKDIKTGEVLNDNSQNALHQAEDIINQNSKPNLPQNQTQNGQNLTTQQTMQEQNNVAQNGNMEQILPTQKYYYEKSDNVKIDNLRKDVSKYFDNSEKTHNFVNMLEKIIQDKDIDIRLDENLKDSKGNVANGKYENGTITINPNSNRAGEFIAIHELTHAIGTDSMRNIIENYRKSNVEFDNAVKSLLENYNTTELTDEAMADVSAQLLGNQEYINNLAQTNPSMFRKIYNEIKYLWHQFTGYKNQNQFLEDLQYKWEQAYRSNNKLNDTTNYHISKNFSNEIDKSLRGEISSNNQIKARDYTPKILVNNGVQDLPMLLTQKHLRQIIYTQQEAANLGYKINKKDHYHGLGKDTLIKAIDNIDNPSEIYKQSNNNYLIITELQDSNNNPIIVPIQINGTGTYNDVRILENQISTVYGHKKLDKYLADNNFEIIYQKNRSKFNGEGVKSHDSINASTNSIPPTQENVNSDTTNYSMQESENNSDSFSMDNKGRKLTKEQQEYFKDSKVRDENGNLLIMYHGTPNGNYNEFNEGTYFTSRKEYADGYQNPNASMLTTKQDSSNPKTYEVYLNIKNPFSIQDERAKRIYLDEYVKGGNSLYLDPYTDYSDYVNALDELDWTEGEDLREWLKENHPEYDGLVLDEGGDGGYGEAEYKWRGKSYVPFNSNQIKNVDNLNPTTKRDIRYSKNNQNWQGYLDKNIEPKGTKTNLQDIKIPVKQNIQEKEYSNQKKNVILQNKEKSIAPINNNEDINPYRDTARANKLIKEKNNLIRQVETDMKQTTLPQAKDILNQRIQEIENDYNEKIQGLYDNVNRNQKQNEIETTEKNPTRHEIIQKNREVARENIKNISNWKDKKRGLSYQLETMERNMYDIIPDKAEAKKINETYFEPIHAQEAQKQKFINSYNDRIKQFNLNKYESEAVQLLGEQKYNPDFKADEVKEVLDRVNKNIENGKVDKQKVDNAIEEFRNIYDELFEQENKALRDNGYKEKPYRKGYFPHFIDYVPETKTEKLLNKLGFKIDKRPLPTDIAGITEQFVPGKTWNKSALERKTNKTDYNALKGFDTYITQAADNIFHTENIQRLRGLENEIRYQYSDKGVQERIDNILNDETLYAEEKQDLINNIFEQVDNPMPNLVTELRRYTNALANKKSEADRSIENMIGRDVYSTVNAIENKFGANAVGLNFGSAVTNFIPITQAWSQVSSKNMGRAVIDTMKSYIQNDGFVDSSAFLTSRLKQADKLYKTNLQKVSDKSGFLFNAIDDVTSNIVVRGKYLENIENGMSQEQAIKDADQFARNVMADRSKGALPTKFEEKNPITKAFTQFQLEVNNQYRYMFKDIPRDLANKGLGSIALAFFKMFLGAWLYNEASEKITGRRPAFDPIDIITTAYKDFTNEDKTTYEKATGTLKNVAEELPFVGGLVGGGRIPVNGALPSISNVGKAGTGLVTGEMDSKKALNTLGKEFAKPGYYLLPPFGGSQLKKSIEGISTVSKGGSYGVDKEGKETLQFPVENPTIGDYVKAGIFGKYALPLAKDYTNSNYKSLNAKQTKTYKESNIPYKEYLEYLKANLSKDEDKINYLNSQDWNENQKWGIYTNDIFSDKERKDGSSQLKDSEYAIKNGTSKSDYMKLYNETNKRNMSMPTTKEMKELKKQEIDLKDYVNYQIKIHDKTIEYRDSGKISENGQLNNKEKIQVLLDSNYSSKEKRSIYENSIKSAEKEDTVSTYEVMKTAGLDIDEWLKYEQQDFASDKVDDGTINGKSVSGSKKDKIYNYINNANMNYDQRLLLLGMNYSLNRQQKSEIVDYVNNLKTDYKTRQQILSKVKGITLYKDGRISYK